MIRNLQMGTTWDSTFVFVSPVACESQYEHPTHDGGSSLFPPCDTPNWSDSSDSQSETPTHDSPTELAGGSSLFPPGATVAHRRWPLDFSIGGSAASFNSFVLLRPVCLQGVSPYRSQPKYGSNRSHSLFRIELAEHLSHTGVSSLRQSLAFISSNTRPSKLLNSSLKLLSSNPFVKSRGTALSVRGAEQDESLKSALGSSRK